MESRLSCARVELPYCFQEQIELVAYFLPPLHHVLQHHYRKSI